jgi:hypothetical protein
MAQNSPPDDFSSAIDHLRSTAKWVLVVFALVGGALTAGVQLSSLGRLEGWSDPRFRIALAAVAVALSAAGIAVWSSVLVLAIGHTSWESLLRDEQRGGRKRWWKRLHKDEQAQESEDLRAVKDQDPGLLGSSYRTFGALQGAFEGIERNYKSGGEGPKQDKEKLKRDLDNLSLRKYEILRFVRYDRVRRQFRRSVRYMFAAGMVAAVAITVFAWAANPPPNEAPFAIPTEAYLELTEDGRELLRDQIGSQCIRSDIHVVVLGATAGVYDVVSVPRAKPMCKAYRFTLTEGDQGLIRPASRVTIPTPPARPTAENRTRPITPTRAED